MCAHESHTGPPEICLWCLGLHKPSGFLWPPHSYPTIINPRLDNPSLVLGCVSACVWLCAPALVCWHFPCILPCSVETEEEQKYSHILWRSQICYVCSTFCFFFNTSSENFSPFFTPVAYPPSFSCHIVCTEADQFPLFFMRCLELFKCSPLPLSSALCCELANFAGIGEKLEEFCVIANVIFVTHLFLSLPATTFKPKVSPVLKWSNHYTVLCSWPFLFILCIFWTDAVMVGNLQPREGETKGNGLSDHHISWHIRT